MTPQPPTAAADILDAAHDLFSCFDEQPGPRLAVVPRRAKADSPAAPAKKSLAEHVNTVDYIACTIERLDDADLTEEVRNELSAQLIEAMAGTRAKVDSTSRVIAMYEGFGAWAKAERERLEEREAYYTRLVNRMNDYVLAILTASNLARLDGETSTLKRQKNPQSVWIDAPAAVPAEYMRTPPRPAAAPDKVAIKNAILAGETVDGCSLVNTYRLVRS